MPRDRRSADPRTLPKRQRGGAWRHRVARTGGGRSAGAAGENRNRRGAPSPSPEIGATPDLRQSGRAQRPAFAQPLGSTPNTRGRLVPIPRVSGICRKSVAFELAAGGWTRRESDNWLWELV